MFSSTSIHMSAEMYNNFTNSGRWLLSNYKSIVAGWWGEIFAPGTAFFLMQGRLLIFSWCNLYYRKINIENILSRETTSVTLEFWLACQWLALLFTMVYYWNWLYEFYNVLPKHCCSCELVDLVKRANKYFRQLCISLLPCPGVGCYILKPFPALLLI